MANNNRVDVYDKSEVYEKKIKPLINELVNVCSINRIPLYVTVAPVNTETGTTYHNDGVMTGSREIHLYDDKIKHHMLVSGGCIAVSPATEYMIDMDIMNMDDLEELDV